VGDTIFDPFAGSGSLLALSEVMGRNAIGVDINNEYKELFENQIRTGAQEYWDRRKHELDVNKDYLLNFKETNKILRIHKVTSVVVNEIVKNNPNIFFKPVVFDHDENNSTFSLLLISQDLKMTISTDGEDCQSLFKQAKIYPQIRTLSFNAFHKLIKGKGFSFYKYTTPKIYSYTSTVSLKTLVNQESGQSNNIFYSIFSLKLK
jgi:hypothetical protein